MGVGGVGLEAHSFACLRGLLGAFELHTGVSASHGGLGPRGPPSLPLGLLFFWLHLYSGISLNLNPKGLPECSDRLP